MPANFKKIDKAELDRITELEKRFNDGETIKGKEIFQSTEIEKIAEKGSTLYTSSFGQAKESMPSSCLFHSRILIEICPNCSCAESPDLLKPYLDRNLVLPLLTFPLSAFPTRFAELIIQRPYVSVSSYNFIRKSWYFIDRGAENKDEQVVCTHCFSKQKRRILTKIGKCSSNTQRNNFLKDYVKECVLPVLSPVSLLNLRMLDYLEQAVDHKNFSLIKNVGQQASMYNTLRLSNLLNSMPQVAEKDVLNIKSELGRLGLDNQANEIDAKMNAIQALGLDYNPKISIDEYLDIIMPRRNKVNALVDSLLVSKDKDKIVSSINEEIWKINDELSISKKVEMLTYTSDFVFNNSGLLFSLLVGGIIGYSSGSFIGCGVGSSLGSIGGYAGTRLAKKRLKLPKYPKKTIEWLKEKVEDPQEKILAIAMSKDVKVIQVWNLRRKLKQDI